MTDLAALPATPLGRYRHYKGGEYEVLAVARHSETDAALVVYRPLLGDTGWWVRPHAMFFGSVTIDGRVQPRFAAIAALHVDADADPAAAAAQSQAEAP